MFIINYKIKTKNERLTPDILDMERELNITLDEYFKLNANEKIYFETKNNFTDEEDTKMSILLKDLNEHLSHLDNEFINEFDKIEKSIKRAYKEKESLKLNETLAKEIYEYNIKINLDYYKDYCDFINKVI